MSGMARYAANLEARAEQLRNLIASAEARRAEAWRRSMPGSATIARHCTDSIERFRVELRDVSGAAVLIRKDLAS